MPGPQPGTHAATNASPWLRSPGTDLLLGCGLGYALSVPLLLAATRATGIAAWPATAVYLLSLFVSGPHYGATLLRILDSPVERHRYRIVMVGATLLVGAWLVAGVHVRTLGALLVTAYVFWSPWHFAGQNYGLALLFLRRRGVAIDARSKRRLHRSFVATFLLALLALNTASSTTLFAVGVDDATRTYPVWRVLLHPALAAPLAALLVAGWALLVVAAVVPIARRAGIAAVGPPLALVGSQALWFVAPALLLVTDRGSSLGLAFAAAWISAAHAVQYLWITSVYARRSDPASGGAAWLGRATLAGAAYLVVPGMLLAPGLLGRTPWDAGLSVLVISAVNVHHFVLDGAIWKLRDGRVAGLLLRPPPASPVPARDGGWPGGARRPWALAATALGMACLAMPLAYLHEKQVALAPSTGLARLQTARTRLAWMGRASPAVEARLARTLADRGDGGGAVAAYRRSLAMAPSAAVAAELAALHEARGDWSAALDAWDAAMRADPADGEALLGRLRVRARRDGATDPAQSATEALEERIARDPGDVAAARALARAYDERGRPDRAEAVLEAAAASAGAGSRLPLLRDLALRQSRRRDPGPGAGPTEASARRR